MLAVIKSIRDLADPTLILENSAIFGVVLVFLTMYSPRLAPRLPESILSLFDSALFRAFMLFLIVYLSSRDVRLSLTIIIVFVVVMNVVSTNHLQERFRVEKFSTIYGPPVSNCSILPPGQGNALGNYYYPLNDTNASRKLRESDLMTPYADEPTYNSVLLPQPVEEGLGN